MVIIMKKWFILLIFTVTSATAWGATKTVTLTVSNMVCPACPITVKKALSKVAGVSQVDVAYEKRQVTVKYDDSKVSVQQLTKATEDAGYPSIVPQSAK